MIKMPDYATLVREVVQAVEQCRASHESTKGTIADDRNDLPHRADDVPELQVRNDVGRSPRVQAR